MAKNARFTGVGQTGEKLLPRPATLSPSPDPV